jgi:hypothetical protein
VLRIAILLAISATSPVMPPSTVSSGAAIAVCFSPEEDCAGFAVRAIDNAEHEILVGAYGLTTGSGIVEALVRAIGTLGSVRPASGKQFHPLRRRPRVVRGGA